MCFIGLEEFYVLGPIPNRQLTRLYDYLEQSKDNLLQLHLEEHLHTSPPPKTRGYVENFHVYFHCPTSSYQFEQHTFRHLILPQSHHIPPTHLEILSPFSAIPKQPSRWTITSYRILYLDSKWQASCTRTRYPSLASLFPKNGNHILYFLATPPPCTKTQLAIVICSL